MRRIKISLKEDPTAKLDYRQVYFAGKTWEKFTTSDKDRQLQDALMMGDPMTEIDIAMQVNYFQLNSAEYFMPDRDEDSRAASWRWRARAGPNGPPSISSAK